MKKTLWLLLFLPLLACGQDNRTYEVCQDGTKHQTGDCPGYLTSASSANVAATTADGAVTIDRDGGVLYGCVNTSATSLTVAQIITCSGGVSDSTAIMSSGQKTLNFTGLSGSTGYYIHFGHRRGYWDSNVVATSQFTTEASAALGDVVSEESECSQRIGGGGSCSDATIRCVGSGQEYDTDGGVQAAFASAVSAMSAGDAMCVRGGTYTYTGSGAFISISSSKNCTSGNECHIEAYPGEEVIFHGVGTQAGFQDLVIDGGSEIADGSAQYAFLVMGDYWHIGYFEIRYFDGDESFATIVLEGDNNRIHHNYIHDGWSDLIRIRPSANSDDSGDGANGLLLSSKLDATGNVIDHNLLVRSRRGNGIYIYPSGSNDYQVLSTTYAYNIIIDNGHQPDGTNQPCTGSNCNSGDFGARGTTSWGNSDAAGSNKTCFTGDPVTSIRCDDLTMRGNIAINTNDDCYDTTMGTREYSGNIAAFCGPSARRGFKDFLPPRGAQTYFGNLVVGTRPMLTGDWEIGEDQPFFLQCTEWALGTVSITAINNTCAILAGKGLDIYNPLSTTVTSGNTIARNNTSVDTNAGTAFTGLSGGTFSNNVPSTGDGADTLVEVGSSNFGIADISLNWDSDYTKEEIHRFLWLQFYELFKPASGSSLIDGGVTESGVHCASADSPSLTYPLSTGYDDTCQHYTGSVPDVGYTER